MSKRGVSKELESKIIAAWKNGYTHDMIADKYHVSKSIIERCCAGVKRIYPAIRRKRNDSTTEHGGIDKGKIRALWRAGWSIPDISDDMNLDETAIENVLRGEGNEQKTDKQSADN